MTTERTERIEVTPERLRQLLREAFREGYAVGYVDGRIAEMTDAEWNSGSTE